MKYCVLLLGAFVLVGCAGLSEEQHAAVEGHTQDIVGSAGAIGNVIGGVTGERIALGASIVGNVLAGIYGMRKRNQVKAMKG